MHKMKKFLFLIFPFGAVTLLATTVFAQTTHNVITDRVKCTYTITDGRITGPYESYYKTGQIKAKGELINGMRTGIWKVWDAKGNLIVQREFSDPFTYKQVIPIAPKDDPVELLNTSIYEIKYNDDGYIEPRYITKDMVLWAKRIWRYAEPENNDILFKYDYFLQFMTKLALSEAITVYSTADDEFRTPLSTDEINISGVLKGFIIKEDAFFDRDRQVNETRILGICPLLVNDTGDTTKLFWAYFPELRKYMAKEMVSDASLPEYIKTLDDLFFYRHFTAQIIKESNVYDRYIKDYAFDEVKEAERIEISTIEAEHDFWMELNGKCGEKHD